jgi:hypothetical protein
MTIIVCFVVCRTTLELECAILTTLYLIGVKNTDSWCARKGSLQRAFHLDVLMVLLSAFTVTEYGERLSCNVFSLDETIHFGSLELIAGLSLSHVGDDLRAAIMGSTRGGTTSPLRAMIEDSVEEKGGSISLSLKARRGGFNRPRHNHTVAGDYSNHSSHHDHSTRVDGGTTRAPTQGGKDPIDRLCSRPSSGQGIGSHYQP